MAYTYRYDAFGNELSPASTRPNPQNPNPFRFAGEYYDAETGTYYLRARHFNPRTGRFTQPDPHWGIHNMTSSTAAIMQSGNLFMYAIHNPIMWIDPSGLNIVGFNDVGNPIFNAGAPTARFTPDLNTIRLECAAARRSAEDLRAFMRMPREQRVALIWDNVTVERIERLHPAIQNEVIAFIFDAQSQGIYLRV